MEVNSQILKDREMLKKGWAAMYLRILGDEEGEYKVPCRFVIDRSLGVRCKTGDLEIFSQSSYDIYTWMPPGVGYPETVDTWFSKNAVEAGEIGGRLRRYKIGDLFVIELRVHNVLMLEVWRGDERLFTRTIWLRDSDASNGAIVAHLLKDYLSIDQAIDVAIAIFCSGKCNREWFKQSIRVELTLENLEFPDTPLSAAVRYGSIVEKAEDLKGRLGARRWQDVKYGEVTLITVPAACSYYTVTFRGGSRGLALLCTANRPSDRPQDAVAEVDGIYLTERPLRLSYFNNDTTVCTDVGDRCLPIIGHLIDEEALAVERNSELAQLKIVETKRYRAYYVDSALAKLIILEVDGRTVGAAVGNIDEVKEKIRNIVYQQGDEEMIDAVESALMYIGRRV